MHDTELYRLYIRLPDRESFSAIYEQLKQPVYTICLRILGSREAAEDVCQEVFLKLYTLPPEPSVHNVHAWVFRMARNLAIDALRSRQRQEWGPLYEQEAVFSPDLDTRLDVEAAIASLPLKDREVLTLHLNAGLTFLEISGITGDSLPSVYRTYRRSIKQLRQMLNGGER